MDLHDAIQELYAEKVRLEKAIAALVHLQREAGGKIPPMLEGLGGRGRKSMGPDEREQVAARMRKYWASRRQMRPEKLESQASSA